MGVWDWDFNWFIGDGGWEWIRIVFIEVVSRWKLRFRELLVVYEFIGKICIWVGFIKVLNCVCFFNFLGYKKFLYVYYSK